MAAKGELRQVDTAKAWRQIRVADPDWIDLVRPTKENFSESKLMKKRILNKRKRNLLMQIILNFVE